MKGHMVLLYLKSRWRGIAAFAVFVAASGVCAALYSLPFEAVLYPALLVAAFAVVMAILDILRTARRHGALSALRALPDDLSDYLPEPDTIAEEDLSEIIRRLEDRISRLTDDFSRRESDTINYYTMWAHQIKTPISAMSLILKSTDTQESRQLAAELSRVSQYVDMVMAYLRLGSDSTDYTFRETPLDDILRAEVRSFASEFIYRKIALDFTPTGKTVLTDRKWLGFVIGQVLSNALKYTREGKISVFMSPPDTLCVRDTGIGIPPEDLPRVFEPGYTGMTGRSEEGRHSSGIGLYLCKMICGRLGHTIRIESDGNGTSVYISFPKHSAPVD